ncbi:uncharacterized protein LOC131625252 [Vicia villosa]|uniref:uncharacterized protein LOC131625252 n=1 Tax=Vicia villosa TaxID=3911 RepID=UPI00273B7A23|nr:uncharacterized protein LOC131625252 [Vicia villosa]
MQIEKENEENAMDSLLCPSFSTYSSNNLNDVAHQVIYENDSSNSQNDDFEFVAFEKTSDEVFFDHRRRNTAHRVFPIFNRDGDKRNSDAAEISVSLRKLINRDGERKNSDAAEILTPLRKLMIGDAKRNIDPPSSSSSSSEVEDDLEDVLPASCCLWTPKSPMASPIKCKKSNSTGSSSNFSASKRWKFLSLLRRSKSDGKESLILVTPSLEFKKEAKVEKSKVKSGEKSFRIVAEKNIPVTERKIPAPVTAMEAFYLRKKENKRKSNLAYKQELIGFGIGFNAHIGRVHV